MIEEEYRSHFLVDNLPVAMSVFHETDEGIHPRMCPAAKTTNMHKQYYCKHALRITTLYCDRLRVCVYCGGGTQVPR